MDFVNDWYTRGVRYYHNLKDISTQVIKKVSDVVLIAYLRSLWWGNIFMRATASEKIASDKDAGNISSNNTREWLWTQLHLDLLQRRKKKKNWRLREAVRKPELIYWRKNSPLITSNRLHKRRKKRIFAETFLKGV